MKSISFKEFFNMLEKHDWRDAKAQRPLKILAYSNPEFLKVYLQYEEFILYNEVIEKYFEGEESN